MIGILEEFCNLISCKQRFRVEWYFTICIDKLHIYPRTNGMNLSTLLQHISLLLTGRNHSGCIAFGNISITAIDYVIVVADFHVNTCSVFVLVFIAVLTKVHDGCNGVTYIGSPIYQVTTALIENHITLRNVLQRL